MLFIILVSLNSYSAVFINEIMYNPSTAQGDDSDLEWIELFNNGTQTINLENFTINGNNFEDVNITAGGFVIVARELIDGADSDLNSFEAYYGNNDSIWNSTDAIYATVDGDFVLDNTAPADIINLSDGTYAQLVNYTPFLTLANGNGKTLIPYKGNFTESAFVNGTPGASNDQFAPDFNKWINPNKNNSLINGLFNISVNITDVTNVSLVLVNFNGTNLSMTKNGDIWRLLWNTRLNANKLYNITAFFNDSYGKSGFEVLFNISLNNTNTAPSITSVNLTNMDFLNRTNGTLQAFWGFTDIDYDSITANETFWHINGTLIADYTNKTYIHPANTTKLENWTFSVRVFDSFNWSDFVNSLTMIIRNAKPSLNISAASIILSETQKVNVSSSASDLDGDLLNYTINDSRFSREGDYFIWNTNLSDAGVYKANITANDGTDFDSLLITIIINDARDLDNDGNPDFNESDDDNDGISDENDFLLGNLSSINTTMPLSININGTANLSKLFNGTYVVNITNGSEQIIEFNFTFNSSSILDFGNITINRTIKGSSAISIRGLRFASTKTFFLEKMNTNVKSVCIKDADAGFDTISSGCDAANETLLMCDNLTSGQYACFDTGLRYKVIGLSHSAVKEQCKDVDEDGYGVGCTSGNDCNDNDASKTTDCSSDSSSGGSSSGGGSGGGGGVTCISSWQCEDWSRCINGLKNRKCHDASQCAFPTKKPEVTQGCVEEIKAHIVSAIKQTERADTTIENATKSSTEKNPPSIAGGVVAAVEDKNANIGVFIIFLEVFIIVGAYSAAKTGFIKI